MQNNRGAQSAPSVPLAAWLLWPYRVLWFFMLPFVLLRLWWRGRVIHGYRQCWGERFGRNSLSGPVDLWWHAVSVGEVIASVPTLKQLRQAYPELRIWVSVTTPTGRACACERLPDFDIAYAPFDLSEPLACVFGRLKPRVVVLMETELWPEWLHQAAAHGVPVILANARLSEKSAQGYARLGGLARPLLHSLAAISAQSDSDAERFVRLGARADTVTVAGNLKFDMPDVSDQVVQGKALRAQWGRSIIWVAASTHQGEESMVLRAHQQVMARFPQALLVLVPRHPDRFQAVADATVAAGFDMVRRSAGHSPVANTQVYLGDTMGELLLLMAVSDAVFVGGSLVVRGGHNLLEPVQVQVPVLTGPNIYNFSHIHSLLTDEKGVVTVNDADELASQVIALLSDPDLRAELTAAASRVLLQNRGAQARLVSLIADTLGLGTGRK